MGKKDQVATDPEGGDEKLKYPISVFFIVTNEFCERFCYYGMRTILSLYLTTMLAYTESTATIIFHAFTMMVYFFPIFGAMLADSLLGKFNTIFYVSIIYAIGSFVLSAAATPVLNMPIVAFSMIGLLLIAIGTGGIKPCVSAFGGDQFILPQQQRQLTTFFSLFYFSINSGSLFSTFITPILRDQSCFDNEQCFTLAFGVPGVLMVLSIIVFACGKPFYRIKRPEGNMVITVSKCIGNAISERSKTKEKKEHFMDHAKAKYGDDLVNDIKALLAVLYLYIPLPFFWALFDQQGTTWTFQAVRMDGDIGFYNILPDQMMIINPILILGFIPLFETCIYPVFNKFNFLTTPIKRIAAGGFLAAVAFALSAGVNIAIEDQEPILPEAGLGHLNFYNNLDCPITINTAALGEKTCPQYQSVQFIHEFSAKEYTTSYEISGDCIPKKTGDFKLVENNATGYYFGGNNNMVDTFMDSVGKDNNGYPLMRILCASPSEDLTQMRVTLTNSDGANTIDSTANETMLHTVKKPGEYKLKIGNYEYPDVITLKLGGVYGILANIKSPTDMEVKLVEITAPNSIHMMWLLPQYIVITMAEIMFSITGLEFSYSQAPISMKSVLQACWLLTTAVGNLIVVILHTFDLFEKESYNLFLYAGLMIVDMIIFLLMAMSYQYVKKKDDDGSNEIEDGKENEGYTKDA